MTTHALRLLAMVAQLAVLGGCVVPQARYEEARSALAVEQEAHRRTNQKLYDVSQKVDQLAKQLEARERELAERGEQLDASTLAANVSAKEREEAIETVEQLRGELGRVGEHLRAFADQKVALASALDGAEARAKRLEGLEKAMTRRSLALRDVSLLMSDAISSGEVELAVSEGRPVLRLEQQNAFVPNSGELQPGTRALASAVARAAGLHPELGIRISRRAKDAPTATGELQRVADEIEKGGISAERIEVAVETPTSADGADGPVEISLL
jgi:flagellar motor protein MotB